MMQCDIGSSDIPIYVSSSDEYADIWPAFFAIFKREWPEFNGRIYLNTQALDYHHEGLNIFCTKVGNGMKFGETFKSGLNHLPSDRFMLLMIDYFFERKVDDEKVLHLWRQFLKHDMDALYLGELAVPKSLPLDGDSELQRVIFPGGEVSFSFQASFWNRKSICRCIADWENPWFAEYFGCRRCNVLKPFICGLSHGYERPILYDGGGVLHGGGRWLESAASRINFDSIPIDLEDSKRKRGIYVEPLFPRLKRIPGELKLLKYRLKSMKSVWALRNNKH